LSAALSVLKIRRIATACSAAPRLAVGHILIGGQQLCTRLISQTANAIGACRHTIGARGAACCFRFSYSWAIKDSIQSQRSTTMIAYILQFALLLAHARQAAILASRGHPDDVKRFLLAA
jgi:hypothetical protein